MQIPADPNSVPPSSSSENQLMQRILVQLKAWPSALIKLIKQPQLNMEALPHQGSWEPILIYGAAAGAVMGLAQFMVAMSLVPIFAVGLLFQGMIVGLAAPLVGGFIMNLVMGIIAKEPGFYRTAYFAALINLINMVGLALAMLHVFLFLPLAALVGFLLYHYCMVAAQMNKQKALIFVIVFFLLTSLPSLKSAGWLAF